MLIIDFPLRLFRKVALPVLFFIAVFSLGSEPFMHSSDIVDPGDVLQIVIDSNDMENIIVSLVDSQDRAISRAEGFLYTESGRSPVSVVLLGIPSSAPPGDYHLVLNAREGRASRRMEKPLRVAEKTFPEQIIILNNKMETLFSDNSGRKKEESRILWEILTSFEPAAQYHTGSFIIPLEKDVPTAAFGDRRRYRMPDGSESTSIHKGSDFWAEKGTEVYACGRGRVVMARERFLTGNTVIIEHLPGVYTLYYHMDSIAVREGQMVRPKDIIGAVGDTGFATGAHLHWEMRVGATPVNPRIFLSRPLLLLMNN
ncbi:MAG: hypothetical protein CSA76_05620 [Spirochaetales bacterium]|nr:MAG: hypothetical protein CSA76_05620 [Spirochaetales bacterium]